MLISLVIRVNKLNGTSLWAFSTTTTTPTEKTHLPSPKGMRITFAGGLAPAFGSYLYLALVFNVLEYSLLMDKEPVCGFIDENPKTIIMLMSFTLFSPPTDGYYKCYDDEKAL